MHLLQKFLQLFRLAQRTRHNFLSGKARIHHQKIDAVDIIKHFLDLPDRCRRVDREEPLAAVRHEVIERALHLESALIMNRHDVLFVNADPRQLVLRVFNHQMKIKRNTRQFPQSADVVDAKAEVRNELAVHHIDMEIFDFFFFKYIDRRLQIHKV